MANESQTTGSETTEVVEKKNREVYYSWNSDFRTRFTHIDTDDNCDYIGITMSEYSKPANFIKANYTAALIVMWFNSGVTFDSAVARLAEIYKDDPTATPEECEAACLSVFRALIDDKWDPDAIKESTKDSDTKPDTETEVV